MLKYQFQDVKAKNAEVVSSNDSVSVLKYPTGYRDFCVINLKMASGSSHTVPPFGAVAIAFVLKGQTSIEWDGRKSEAVLDEKQAYMLLPETEFKLECKSDSMIYICTCDIN